MEDGGRSERACSGGGMESDAAGIRTRGKAGGAGGDDDGEGGGGGGGGGSTVVGGGSFDGNFGRAGNDGGGGSAGDAHGAGCVAVAMSKRGLPPTATSSAVEDWLTALVEGGDGESLDAADGTDPPVALRSFVRASS